MEFNATFLVAGISFIIFTLLMNEILYQPITDIVLKRKNYIDANLDEAKQNSEKAKNIQDGISDKIADSKTEAKHKVNDEVSNLKQLQTQKEAEKRAEVRENIENEKNKLAQESIDASQKLQSGVDVLSDELVAKFFGGKN